MDPVWSNSRENEKTGLLGRILTREPLDMEARDNVTDGTSDPCTHIVSARGHNVTAAKEKWESVGAFMRRVGLRNYKSTLFR
jgi:hypothetical protein